MEDNEEESKYENPDYLALLTPTVYYKFEEIDILMKLLSGVAFDGQFIASWKIAKETDLYWNIEVMFTDQETYENWYFYKRT